MTKTCQLFIHDKPFARMLSEGFRRPWRAPLRRDRGAELLGFSDEHGAAALDVGILREECRRESEADLDVSLGQSDARPVPSRASSMRGGKPLTSWGLARTHARARFG